MKKVSLEISWADNLTRSVDLLDRIPAGLLMIEAVYGIFMQTSKKR